MIDESNPEIWGAFLGFLLIIWSSELFLVDKLSIKLTKTKFGKKLYIKKKKVFEENMLHSNCRLLLKVSICTNVWIGF